MDAYRKLIIMGTNRLVEKGLITLASTGVDKQKSDVGGYIFAELAGHPSVISWSDAGFEELRISVWWKYDHSKHPQANLSGNAQEKFLTSRPLAKRKHYPKFIGVTVSAWLERKKGPHIQGKGREHLFDLYTRRGEKDALDALPVVNPTGYGAEGKFFM